MPHRPNQADTRCRGHFRPLLHTALNLVALHPELHFTLLVAPSAHPRVTAELALPSLAHLHRHTQVAEGLGPVEPVVSRIQVVEVVDPALVLQRADASALERTGGGLADEDEMFERMLPRYLETLWRADGQVFPDEGVNRFVGVDPGFVVYDVSLPPVMAS